MPTGSARVWTKIPRERRVLVTLAPLFALALVLAWLLSSETVFSLFQSPTSPLPPTEEAPLPTETSTPTDMRPTPTSPPPETPPTLTPTVPPPQEVAEPTVSPTERVTEPTASPTEAAFTPAVEVAAHPPVSSTAETPAKGGLAVWPWVLLGFLSVGAMAAGVFLLRREPRAEDEEGRDL